MYIVPQSAPAASAAATPRAAWPPGAWVDDATASSVAPANIAVAPPSTPSRRARPASRSSLKNTTPHTMPSRLFAFHSGNAMLRPMSLIAKMVRVLATAQRHPASTAHTVRCGAWRRSAPIADVPRSRAGTLQRARNTPSTIVSEITTGEIPSDTILVGASAAPSHAPAAKPLSTPTCCSRWSRPAATGSTRAPRDRAAERRRGPRTGHRAAWRRGAPSHRLLGEVAGGELPGRDLAQRRRLGAAALVLLGVGAARMERTAGRRVGRRRRLPRQNDTRAPGLGVRHGHGGEERGRVRVSRRGVQRGDGGALYDLPEVHHRHVGQEIEHLRLDRDVERAHGLVEHEELRLDGERARDADALALASRQLVRVA